MRLIFTSRKPLLHQIFDAICFVLAWGFILALAFVALHVEATTEFFYFEIPYSATPPAASACGGRIIACHNNDAATRWQCYCVK